MRRVGKRAGASFVAPLRAAVDEFTREPLRLGPQSLLLVLVSAADLLMTYALLRQGVRFYESNPLARWWFVRWNMAGMTAFKFLMIAVAIVVCEVVERRRPGLGRGVVNLGIVAALGVVAYSVQLFLRHVGGFLG